MTFLWRVAPVERSELVHSKATNDVKVHGMYAALAICCSDCHADCVTARHAPMSSFAAPHSLVSTLLAPAMAKSPPFPCDVYGWHWAALQGLWGSKGLPCESE